MTIEILKETFKSDGHNAYGYIVGTAEIRISGRSHTVRAVGGKDGSTDGLDVAGFVGRYRTSAKAWPASVSLMGERVIGRFGRDDRSGRFNKLSGVSFEPALYASLTNPKWWAAA